MTFSCGAQGTVDAGGTSIAFEWWPGPGPVVCLHGLTSHRRAFAALADELSPRIGILALDLRGRGDSDKPEGPYGMAVHAADVAAVLHALDVREPAVLAGHSMGAFVVSAFAAKFPERLRAAILLDGGDFRPAADADPETLMETILATFVERLTVSWPSVDALCAAFEATPIYAGRMDDAARRYFAFDVAGEAGDLRAKARIEGVRADWREILTEPRLRDNLAKIVCPALLVTAPGGLNGTGDAVITDEIVEDMRAGIARLAVVPVPDENHHTMLTTRGGAAKTARAMEEFLASHALV